MTLLAIAQDVADVIGITRPTAIVTGQDQIARQILGLAQETLEELGLMDWPKLEIPYTFNTVVGQAEYDLPSDFGREVGDTVYLGSRYEGVRGSLSPADWQRARVDNMSLGRYKFRIFGLPLKLHITPTPDAVEAVVLEYQTTYRVQQDDMSYKNRYYADTDVSLMPEDLVRKGLKWRLRRAKGLDYSEEFDDYELARDKRLGQQLQLGSMPVAYRRLGEDDGDDFRPYLPENGYG